MKLRYQMIEKPDHLLVVAAGKWRLQAGLEMIEAIGHECRRLGCDRVLVDGGEIAGEFPDLDRFESGQQVAMSCRGIRMVFFCDQRHITHFGENVAVNRGAAFYVTSDMNDAMRWLMAGADQTRGNPA